MKINKDKVKELLKNKPLVLGASIGIVGTVLSGGILSGVILGTLAAYLSKENKGN